MHFIQINMILKKTDKFASRFSKRFKTYTNNVTYSKTIDFKNNLRNL